MAIAYAVGMINTKQTRTIKIEQPNGDSFQKRVNALCRYYSNLEGITDSERKEYVRDAVVRIFDNAEVAIYITRENGLVSIT